MDSKDSSSSSGAVATGRLPSVRTATSHTSKRPRVLHVIMAFVLVLAALMALTFRWASTASLPPPAYGPPSYQPSSSGSCDSVELGYQCQPRISHFWGQYSPYFAVPSEIPTPLPPQCRVTFAQVLSRHGARFPTASKSTAYNQTISAIRSNVTRYEGKYAFLAGYKYSLGADDLTRFGEQQMVNSGEKFFRRYDALAREVVPFVRSSGEDRVVVSARNFSQGFHAAKVSQDRPDKAYPYPVLVIPEGDAYNNSLDHSQCDDFENGPTSEIGDNAQKEWAAVFVPPIQTRLNQDLPGAKLTTTQVIHLMDLCPFDTVSHDGGSVSPFCALFSDQEWHHYAYYQSLGKYYGYSSGNPLGPTQGVGFVNELVARLTNSAVKDRTSTNRTLDSNPATFPLGRKLYADFSHDNDMTAVFAAVGLYNGTAPLSNTTIVEAERNGGYSAAWTVPFGARAYFEKLQCVDRQDEQIRVIINDRVQPLTQCLGDSLGRCSVDSFVESLSFARQGGRWDSCFV